MDWTSVPVCASPILGYSPFKPRHLLSLGESKLRPFFFGAGQVAIQQVFHIVLILQCLHKQRVPVFFWCPARIQAAPVFHQVQVVCIHPEKALLCLILFQLFRNFWLDRTGRSPSLPVIVDSKVCRQPLCRFLCVQTMQPGCEINHIPVCLAGKAMEPLPFLRCSRFFLERNGIGT